MKKTFKAPPLAEVKPPRKEMVGRPHGTIPTERVKTPYVRKGDKSFFHTKRMINEGHKFFFSRRPELHIPNA
jgi:hypothetical protein